MFVPNNEGVLLFCFLVSLSLSYLQQVTAMPPRRYPLNTSASKNSQAALTQRSLIDPHLEPQEGNQSQTHTSSKYSKTLQSRTHAKKSLQQASSARPRGAGEAVGHDKRFGDEDSDSLDGIGEESGTDAEEQGRVTHLWLLIVE